MYRPALVTAPAAPPVSLVEAKAHLRVEVSDDETVIAALIGAAVSYLDGWTGILGRCLVNQTWRQSFDEFDRCLRLPLAPVQSIAAVKYLDMDGVEQTVDGDRYQLLSNDLGWFVRFKDSFTFPTVHPDGPAVNIEYVAGYGAPADVPPAIKQAMLLLIGHWYEHREAVMAGGQPTMVPMAADALLAPFRRLRF